MPLQLRQHFIVSSNIVTDGLAVNSIERFSRFEDIALEMRKAWLATSWRVPSQTIFPQSHIPQLRKHSSHPEHARPRCKLKIYTWKKETETGCPFSAACQSIRFSAHQHNAVLQSTRFSAYQYNVVLQSTMRSKVTSRKACPDLILTDLADAVTSTRTRTSGAYDADLLHTCICYIAYASMPTGLCSPTLSTLDGESPKLLLSKSLVHRHVRPESGVSTYGQN